MIVANARHLLTREDAQLAVRLVAKESDADVEEVQQRLVDHGIDAILDDNNLPRALLRSPFGAYASLPAYCRFATTLPFVSSPSTNAWRFGRGCRNAGSFDSTVRR